MKNAIILHGYPSREEYLSDDFASPSTHHWLAWLQAKLLQKDIYAETPIMPEAYAPDYEKWKKAVERCDHIGEDTIIVGHSCGGGFWVRYLSEHKDLKVGKVVLVAPWLDPDHTLNNDYFDFKIDESLAARTKGLVIFASDNERHKAVDTSIGIIKQKVHGVEVVDFHNYGHFCFEDMNTHEFPELLEECLR